LLTVFTNKPRHHGNPERYGRDERIEKVIGVVATSFRESEKKAWNGLTFSTNVRFNFEGFLWTGSEFKAC
jgi:hypothetical protein